MRRVLLACGREVAAVGLRLAVYFGIFALIAVMIIELLPVAQSLARVPGPDRPVWVPIERPHEAFALAIPDMPNSIYRSLRHTTDGGRKDIITAEGNGRAALVEVYRPGDILVSLAAESEIERRAEEIGRVEKISLAPSIDTRFGKITLADFTLADGERRRGCLGFVRVVDDPAMQITGWVCLNGPGMVARNTVACVFDKLILLSAGGDPKVAKLFAQAGLKGSYCIQPRNRGVAGRPPDWIDGRQMTTLRGAMR